MTQNKPAAGHLPQQEIDALGYAYRPDETTDDPELDRPVTPEHCDYGDEYDFPVIEIHEATGESVNIGGSKGHEPVAFAVATEEDALEAMRLLSLILGKSGCIQARLHYAPEDYDDYRITKEDGAIPLEPE